MSRETFRIHLEKNDQLIFMSPWITSYVHYREVEQQLAQYLIDHYPQFKRFQMIGPVQAWIRDNEFDPHIQKDIEQGRTPALAAVLKTLKDGQQQIYLKTILPDHQLEKMTREQRFESAMGDGNNLSGKDIISAFLSIFVNNK